jgi:hypothetical protein
LAKLAFGQIANADAGGRTSPHLNRFKGHGRLNQGEEVKAMKALTKLGAALVMGAISMGVMGIGTAHACEYQCYDSGNTGEHCEYTNC